MALIIDQKEMAVVDTTGVYLCCEEVLILQKELLYALKAYNGMIAVTLGFYETPDEVKDAIKHVIKSLQSHDEFIYVPVSKISERLKVDGTLRTD